jgi:hypothetical protein
MTFIATTGRVGNGCSPAVVAFATGTCPESHLRRNNDCASALDSSVTITITVLTLPMRALSFKQLKIRGRSLVANPCALWKALYGGTGIALKADRRANSSLHRHDRFGGTSASCRNFVHLISQVFAQLANRKHSCARYCEENNCWGPGSATCQEVW